ncbi:unnamed protein product [Prunus brigantina]
MNELNNMDNIESNLSSTEVREARSPALSRADVKGIASSAPILVDHVGAFLVGLHLLWPFALAL